MKYAARRLGSLHGSVKVASTAADASVGAEAGSVIPGIGTAVGAVIGAVYGIISGWNAGSKPQRAAAAAQFLNALLGLPSTYVGRTLSYQNFADMNRAIFITGHMDASGDPAMHPSAMDGNFIIVAQIFKYLVQVASQNPTGATVNTLIPRTCAPNGCWPSVNYTFVNPGLADSAVFSQQVAIPAIMAVSDKVEGTGFNKYFSDPVAVKYYDLLTDYTIGNYGLLPGTAQTAPAAQATAAAVAQAVQSPNTAAAASQAPAAVPVVQSVGTQAASPPAVSIAPAQSTASMMPTIVPAAPVISLSVAPPAQVTQSPEPDEGDLVATAPNASFPWLWVILGGALLLALT
jgi:hypothetical protein